MNTPQPNAPTPPTPPVIPVSTTPLGAVQTLISQLPPPVASQSTPSPHTTPASPLEISPYAPVPTSSTPAPAPVHATETATDPTVPAPASVSLHGGRAPTPPRENARVTRSYPALPEPSRLPPRPIPLLGGDGFRRRTAHYIDDETVRQTRDDRVHVRSLVTNYISSWPPDPSAAAAASFDQYPEGSVGARLRPSVDDATAECAKAERTGENERRLSLSTVNPFC